MCNAMKQSGRGSNNKASVDSGDLTFLIIHNWECEISSVKMG